MSGAVLRGTHPVQLHLRRLGRGPGGRGAEEALSLHAAVWLVGVLDVLAPCDAAVARAPASYEAYLCYFQVGTREKRVDGAAARLDALRDRAGASGWPLLVRAQLARFRRETPAHAAGLFREAAARFAADGNTRGEVLARTNLHTVQLELGDLAGAEEQVSRSRQAAQASGDPEAVARASVLEAKHLVRLGKELGRAHRLLRRVEVGPLPDGVQQSVLWLLAELSHRLGRHDEAVATASQLIERRETQGDLNAVVRLRSNIVDTRQAQYEERPYPGTATQLRAAAEAALQAARERDDAAVLARIDALLGDLAAEAHPELARSHYRRCLERAGTLPVRESEMYCLSSMARRLGAHDPQAAEHAFERASRIAVEHGNDVWTVDTLRAGLRTVWHARPREDAMREALRMLDGIERLRLAQTDPQARVGLLTGWTKDYYWLAGQLLGAEPVAFAAAFDVSERMRARVLLDTLEAAGVSDRHGATGREPASNVGLEAVRLRLAPDEAMVVFLIGLDRDLYGGSGGGSWALWITRDHVEARRTPDRLQLEDMVPAFVGLLEARDGSETVSAAALYGQLLGGLDERPGIRHLILVPDGILHRLPFAALRAHPEAEPLGARHEISVAPSATLWHLWASLPALSGPAAALVFAAPELPPAARAAGDPLAHAAPEGRAVRRAVGGRSLLLSGRDAAESALKAADLGRFAVVHFASHAVADDAYPDRSAVLLAPGTDTEDGLLQPPEISSLDLRGRAVVLSACQTAAGPVVGGEGVLSLARSFFAAGARTVVAGRWALRDDEARRMTGWLYEELARGGTMGSALRFARRRAIDERLPAAAWAGLSVFGDGGFVLPARARGAQTPPWWALLLLIGVVIGGLLAARWHARRRRAPAPPDARSEDQA